MARTPFKMRSGNSPIAKQGHFVTDEHGEVTQVSKTDYDKAKKENKPNTTSYSTGRERTAELNEGYESDKKRAIARGADKKELANLKESFISGNFEEYQDELAYSATPEGKADAAKQKKLNKK
tara:strand:+ start:423 stop:791 length:369 start_codon:yes stop_codon:yes gene_type:complete